MTDGTSPSTTTLQALLTDENGNPCPNTNIQLNIPTNGGSVSSSLLSSDSSGIASFILTPSTLPGTYTFNASSSGLTSSDLNVIFLPGLPNTLTASIIGSGSIIADQTSTETIKGVLKDLNGNLLSGYEVSLNFLVNGPSPGSTATNPLISNAQGEVSFVITSSKTTGTYSYSLTESTTTLTSNLVDITFVNGSELQWGQTSFDFGAPTVDTTQTFTLTNIGILDTGTISISKQGGGPNFGIYADNCDGIILSQNQTCDVSIIYYFGKNSSTTLNATSNPGATVSVGISGSAP